MASHAVIKEQLLEMGFEEKLINGALSHLKENATLESVLESIDDGTAAEAAKNPQAEPEQKPAEKKPLTPEELEAKKKEYEEKLKKRRAEIQAKEKEDERLREIQRRKEFQEMNKVREALEKMQQENYIKEIQREKQEAKEAREKILRQIEFDKAERKARYAAAGGESATSKPMVATLPPSASSQTGKTKLAIRLLDGEQLVQEFDVKELLSAVRAFVVTKKDITYNITFSVPPLPPFSETDMDKPLSMLGLSCNSRLQVIKR